MTDEEIKAAYKELKDREEAVREIRDKRNRRNVEIFNLVKLSELARKFEPKTITGMVKSYDSWDSGNGNRQYVEQLDEYIETLPFDCEVRVTVEVTGPVIEERLFLECDFENCGKQFEFGTGAIREVGVQSWEKKQIFLCPEHGKVS